MVATLREYSRCTALCVIVWLAPCFAESEKAPAMYNAACMDTDKLCIAEQALSFDAQVGSTNRANKNTSIEYEVYTPEEEQSKKRIVKDWTVIVYVAADNDLRNFAIRNIKQMTQIGSNEHLNILVHIDIRISGNQKITRRYFIERNKITHVNAHDPSSQQMDSGDPRTLISCCEWAIQNYPAHHYMLVFWNHGTGPVDPGSSRIINPSELFTFNPQTCKLELDRSIGFLDLINHAAMQRPRGICWDDTTGHYLTNQKLDAALAEITTRILKNRKFDIIAFDACLMATIEIADIVKKYSHIMVASQEVELGTGWYYDEALQQFLYTSPSAQALAQHIVSAYAKVYGPITNDYTQSAINLEAITELEENIDLVAQLLIQCLAEQQHRSVTSAIKASRNRFLCTHFEEPSYIDLHHFYSNLLENMRSFALPDNARNRELKNKLQQALERGKKIIINSVAANNVGKNLAQAKGISIYFPERYIHISYPLTAFANTYMWSNFLSHYLFT
jgi:hypothetical protein